MTERDDTGISNLGELLAHAHAIETDAVERYHMLADQMDVHNNRELARIFRELAGHEEKHAAEILAQAGDIELPALKPSEFKWPGIESPEAAELDQAHYRMTPWHALRMALAAEQRAFAFFDHMVETAEEPDVKKWAEEFREEEAEHVELVNRLLEKHSEPEADWQDDPDPPANQE